jgi:hypothetical protein
VIQDDTYGDDGQLVLPRKRTKLFTAIAPKPSEDSAPSESYWVNATRDELRARASARQKVMQQSKFGRIPSPFLSEKA